MKRTTLIHSAWLLTAASTFGIGWVLKPSEQNPASGTAQQAYGDAPSLVSNVRGQNQVLADKEISVADSVQSIAGTMTPTQMKDAVSQMFSEKDKLKRAAMFSSILENLTAENAPETIEAMKANPRRGPFGGGNNEMGLLMNAWGRLDGPAALEYALNQEDEGEGGGRGRGRGPGNNLAASALEGWAGNDPTAAIEWMGTQEQGREAMQLSMGLVQGLIANDINSATDYVNSLPGDNRARNMYMNMIANEKLSEGFDSASAWAAAIEDPSLKGTALSQVVENYAETNPAEAAAWITRYAGEEYATAAIRDVASEWAEQDPAAVIEWASTLSGEAQTSAMSAAFNEWTDNDAFAVSEYLQNMEASPTKDAAISGFANELVGDDPEAAALWASTIGDDNTRLNTLTRVAQQWYWRDAEAAQQWMSTSSLPSTTVQEITTAEPPRRGPGGGGGRGFRGR